MKEAIRIVGRSPSANPDSVALPNVARSPIVGLLMHFVYADSDGAAVTRTDARRTPTVLSEG